VIVVARNRRADLEACLKAVTAVACAHRIEIVAVDDGSVDGTRDLLEAWASEPPGTEPSLLSRTMVVNEQSVGPGLARNRAALLAKADVLLFVDSDARPLEGWFEAMLAPFEDSNVGAVGGVEAPDPHAPPFRQAVHVVLTSPLTTGGLRGRAPARAGRYRPRGFSLGVRRDAFEQIGGFAGLRHGEDIDFGHRIAELGLRVVLAPEAQVTHRRRRNLAAFARQTLGMGRGRGALIRRDRRHAEPVYFLPAIACLAPLSLGLAAALVPGMRPLVGAAAGFGLLWLALVAGSAGASTRSLRVGLLAPAVFVVQLLCYSVGLVHGFVRPSCVEGPPRVEPAS
jgi:GT2 family glycosyltransferase